MREIRYEVPQHEVESLEGEVIFLAGPTVRGNQLHLQPSWRFAAVEEFRRQGFQGSLIIPEFTSLTESDKHRPELPIWENAGLKRADCILFWIPRTRELIGLTTNFEIGYWIGKERDKVVYGRPDDSFRNGYIDIMWDHINKEKETNTPRFNTLENTIAESIKLAKIRSIYSNWKNETPPEYYKYSIALLMSDDLYFYWNENTELKFFVLCNDIFGPGSDCEYVSPKDAKYLVENGFHKKGWREMCQWIADKRGYPKDKVWWIDYKDAIRNTDNK